MQFSLLEVADLLVAFGGFLVAVIGTVMFYGRGLVRSLRDEISKIGRRVDDVEKDVRDNAALIADTAARSDERARAAESRDNKIMSDLGEVKGLIFQILQARNSGQPPG